MTAWVLLGVIVAGLVIGGWIFFTRDNSPLPESYKEELVFSPLVIPTGDDKFSSKNFVLGRAEDGTQLLTYVVVMPDNEIVLSEYTQPVEFVEISEYKEQFLNNVVQQNSTVQTANGTIYVGQLSMQNNQQLGVMLDHGLIVFMKPKTPLDDAEWRQLGETLEIQKAR